MFVSARRIAEKLGIRRPLVCYQGALVADPSRGEVLVHRPIEAPLAREILRAMPERARAPLEPLRRRRAVRVGGERGDPALLAGRRRPDAHRRPAGRLDRAADDEDRHRRAPGRDGRRCATSCSRSSAAARSSRSRCPTSSSSRRPASRRPAAWRCSPTCSASPPSRPWPSATPRTTARCSTGPAAASPSRTPTSASRARPTP